MLWFIFPIIIYFFKINFLFIFILFSIIDFFRGYKLIKKNLDPENYIFYKDEDFLFKISPESTWFLKGMKDILILQISQLISSLFSFIYNFIVTFSYFNFENLYLKNIITLSLFLTLATYISWFFGEVFALKLMLLKKKKELNL